MFQQVNFLCQRIGGISGFYRATGLENNIAVVVQLVHIMNGDTALGVAIGQYRFVYALAVHAFAAVFGQQGGVYINNSIRVSADEGGGHFPEKTRQHDKPDIPSPELGHIGIAPEKPFFFDDQGRDSFLGGYLQNACSGLITND